MGLTALVPGAFELDEPLYVALTALAYVLIVVAPFLPFTAVISSAVLSGVFLWQYPDFENMFTESLILATAVLFSYMRWWAAGLGTLCLLAYQLTATAQGGLDGGPEGLIDLGYGWLTTCLVGAAAGFVELRIRREITRREQAAAENARALETMRTRFTSDTHDTISHSLSTEAAIIKTLGRNPHALGSDRMIAELAMVNAELRSDCASSSAASARMPRPAPTSSSRPKRTCSPQRSRTAVRPGECASRRPWAPCPNSPRRPWASTSPRSSSNSRRTSSAIRPPAPRRPSRSSPAGPFRGRSNSATRASTSPTRP